MKTKNPFILCSSILIFLLVAVTAKAELHSGIKELVGSSLIDKSGNEFSTEVLSGKMIGLYFSAGWCPPCKTFSPKIRDFRNQNSEDFEIVMVSADSSSSAQLNYMKDMDMSGYALALNSPKTNQLYRQFSITGIPTVVILSHDGSILSQNGRSEVTYNANTSISTWKNSPNYVDTKTEEEDRQTETASGSNAPAPPSTAPPARPGSTLEKEIEELKAENARKDALIAELKERAEQCEKLAVDFNASCAALSGEVNGLKTEVVALTGENDNLRTQLSNAETTASACSMELAQVKQQLEQCQAQAQAPFLTEWIYSPEQGWLYTNAEFFPFIYSESQGDWLLYEIGSSSPRNFFNYKDNQWQSW